MSTPKPAPPREAGGRPLLGAFGVALALEVAGIAALAIWIGTAPAAPAVKEAPVVVSLLDSPAPPTPAPVTPVQPKPTPPPPDPPPQTPPPQPPPPQPAPPEPPPPQPAPQPRKPPPRKPRPRKPPRPALPDKPVTHVEAPPVSQPAAAPAIAQAASLDAMALFEGQVHRAIQRAVVYPAAARMAHESGRTRVAFTLSGGRADDAVVVRSSGFPMLDRAALAAVRDARYPAPPPALSGRALRFVIWVEFKPSDDDE